MKDFDQLIEELGEQAEWEEEQEADYPTEEEIAEIFQEIAESEQ